MITAVETPGAVPAGGALVALARRFGVERHVPLAMQVMTFGVIGVLLTIVNYAIFRLGANGMGLNANLAWTAGFVVALALGYTLQSRFVFRPGEGVSRRTAALRYVLVALIGYAINMFWVWLLVSRMGLSTWAPLPLTLFATPVFSFLLNRLWVFR